MRTVRAILNDHLAGKPRQDTIKAYPQAAGFINRSYEWLGLASELTEVQKLMLDRLFLTLDIFCKTSDTTPGSQISDMSEQQRVEDVVKDLFYDSAGRGSRLDAEISNKAGLPKIHPRWDARYQETLAGLKDPQQRELYKVSGAIAAGVCTLSDCHHDTFRFLENWIHGIGTGRLEISTRKAHTEKQRLGQLLFGYALGLDRWITGVPMQFLLLDLGHVDLGFDPKNEIVRVYAYFGEAVTDTKKWLAACLWYSLVHNEQGGLVSHTDLVQACEAKGIVVRQWIES